MTESSLPLKTATPLDTEGSKINMETKFANDFIQKIVNTTDLSSIIDHCPAPQRLRFREKSITSRLPKGSTQDPSDVSHTSISNGENRRSLARFVVKIYKNLNVHHIFNPIVIKTKNFLFKN